MATMYGMKLEEIKDVIPETEKENIKKDVAIGKAVDLIMELRKEAKARKDWATADFIRNRLAEIGFEVKDTKEGVEWKLNK